METPNEIVPDDDKNFRTRLMSLMDWLKEPFAVLRGYVILATTVYAVTMAGIVLQAHSNTVTEQKHNVHVLAQSAFEANHSAWFSLKEQYDTCNTQTDTRNTLRSIFFYMVDLSDLFPGNSQAETYTMHRHDYIDKNYPALDPKRCVQPPAEPVAPKGLFP